MNEATEKFLGKGETVKSRVFPGIVFNIFCLIFIIAIGVFVLVACLIFPLLFVSALFANMFSIAFIKAFVLTVFIVIAIVFLGALSIFIGIHLVAMLFSVAFVRSVSDFNGSYAGLIFLKIKDDTLEFFGIRKYFIHKDEIKYILKTNLLFIKRYYIFYYRENLLSYTVISSISKNIERGVPVEKIAILPDLFSFVKLNLNIGSSFFRGFSGGKGLLAFGKELESYLDQKSLNVNEMRKDFNGGGFVCDCRFLMETVDYIKKSGYFDMEYFIFRKIFFTVNVTLPFANVGIDDNFLYYEICGYAFKVPKINIKRIFIRKVIFGESIAFIHDFEKAPEGLVFFGFNSAEKIASKFPADIVERKK